MNLEEKVRNVKGSEDAAETVPEFEQIIRGRKGINNMAGLPKRENISKIWERRICHNK